MTSSTIVLFCRNQLSDGIWLRHVHFPSQTHSCIHDRQAFLYLHQWLSRNEHLINHLHAFGASVLELKTEHHKSPSLVQLIQFWIWQVGIGNQCLPQLDTQHDWYAAAKHHLWEGCDQSASQMRIVSLVAQGRSWQGWGQVHRYLYLPVLKYIFSSTCLYFVLERQKCTCTCTFTQVHYKVLGTWRQVHCKYIPIC